VTERWSNGPVEGQVNRLKTIKRQMYGRAGVELLRARLMPLPVESSVFHRGLVRATAEERAIYEDQPKKCLAYQDYRYSSYQSLSRR
jgi:hypothetical protein